MTVSRRNPSLAHSWHSEGAEMASIRRRNGRYHVQIRKNGYPSVTKTLIHLKTAKKWASGVEADMERQRYCPIPETIQLGGLLTRYETEVIPTHIESSGGALSTQTTQSTLLQSETQRVNFSRGSKVSGYPTQNHLAGFIET